jgi:transposase-like protein
MPVLSYVHELFNVVQCHAYIHMLRWHDRPLQCPRCQSHDVDPWGSYHYHPGCKRYWCNGCKRTFNDLTNTLLHQSKRSLAYWILATFLLCLSQSPCPLSVRQVSSHAAASGCSRPARRSPRAPVREGPRQRLPTPTSALPSPTARSGMVFAPSALRRQRSAGKTPCVVGGEKHGRLPLREGYAWPNHAITQHQAPQRPCALGGR